MNSVLGGIVVMLLLAVIASFMLNSLDTSSASTFTSNHGSVRLN